jgi:hypothetical protein
MVKHCRRAAIGVSLVVLALMLLFGQAASAHERRGVAEHEIVVGWDVEPAFTGVANAVGVRVTQQGSGEPVEGLQLRVEILFGDKDSTRKTSPLDLAPAFNETGKYSAPIVPSRPGTYTFHMTGQLDGEPFDQYFTSGEGTFDSVKDPQEFPVEDPTRGELAERLSRVDARIQTSTQKAEEAAGTTRSLALGGIALGVIALSVALAALSGTRKARQVASEVEPPSSTSESPTEQ